MLSDLIKRIKDEFASSRMELINQIFVSDDEYVSPPFVGGKMAGGSPVYLDEVPFNN